MRRIADILPCDSHTWVEVGLRPVELLPSFTEWEVSSGWIFTVDPRFKEGSVEHWRRRNPERFRAHEVVADAVGAFRG